MTLRRPLVIRNATRWSTVDLRRLVAAGLAAHGLTHCTVHVVYRRANSGVVGRARVGERGACRTAAQAMWLHMERVPPAEGKLVALFPDKVAIFVAQTIDHEIYHLRGLHHRNFPKHVLRNDRERTPPPWWTAEMRLTWRLPKTPKPAPTPDAKRAARLAHARALLSKATTRAKRAETIRAMWAAKVSRIEREIARSTEPTAIVNAVEGPSVSADETRPLAAAHTYI